MGEGNLGKLVVSITADMSNLDKGLKDADARVKATSSSILETTKKISTTMALVGGAVVGAFGLMVKSAVDYGDQIYEVSQRTGVATETLSRLKYVAEQTESSFEAVSTGLRFLGRNMSEADQGSKEMRKTFDNLGISVRDSNGQMKTSDAVLLELADAFSKSTDEAAKMSIAMQLMGRGGASLIPVLNLGSKGIKELSAEADKLGLTLSKDNAVAIDKFSDGMKSLKAAVGGLYLEIGVSLLPTLTKMLDKAREVVADIKKWADEHPKLAKVIVDTTVAVGALALALGTLGLAITPIVKGFTALWTVLTTVVPLVSSLAVIRAFAWTESIVAITTAFGAWPPILALATSAFAGWTIGTLLGQIKEVDAFLNRVLGVPTENRPMRNGKVMTKEEQATFNAANNIGERGIDLGRIDINKSRSELEGGSVAGTNALAAGTEDKIGSSAQKEAALLKYQELYKEVEEGNLAIDQNAALERSMMAQQEFQEKQSFLQMYNQLVQQSHAGVYAMLTSITQTFHQGLSQALTGIITGSVKAKDAFKALGEQMVQAIVSYLAQQAVAWVISKALASVATAASASMAAALTVAWAPAAFMASVATLGGAVAAGSAALTAGLAGSMATAATVATSSAAAGTAGFAEGTDTVPAMLTPGELVMPRSFADALRAGDLTVSGPGGSNTSQKTITVEINFSPNVNSELDMEKATEQLGRIMEEKLRGV